MTADTPELLLCDSSFVGHLRVRATAPERYEHWSAEDLARVDRGVLAISVVTLAEARFGYLKAGWGAPKITAEEQRLRTFVWVPIDEAVIEEWARIRALCERSGWGMGDNDIWIVAGASSRGIPLVTCDRDQRQIVDPKLEVIFFAPP
ncbi:MAG: hypothetical protein QOI10_2196 [Solirubrobacterales bacterium]|nr:hypothetical protein [Solirubrobacterales bacterium]